MGDQQYKADGGKIRPSLLIDGMPRAMMAVSAVLSYGAQKYEPNSWKKIDMNRYRDAMYRHMLEDGIDEESGLLHLAHQACNVLFLLEDKLSKMTDSEFEYALKFNKPPTDHKEGR